jgi:hypothetical protein
MIRETRRMAAIRERGENAAARTPSAPKAKAAPVNDYSYERPYEAPPTTQEILDSIPQSDECGDPDDFCHGCNSYYGWRNLNDSGHCPRCANAATLAAHEAAAQRRALTRIRANVIAAWQDAMTFESAAADTLWTALRTLDAECVAAGLATCFDASGLAVAR